MIAFVMETGIQIGLDCRFYNEIVDSARDNIVKYSISMGPSHYAMEKVRKPTMVRAANGTMNHATAELPDRLTWGKGCVHASNTKSN
ncbi:hypothetical protein [Candidatus Nitrososphaera evergladensis]|uniref:hypothetical protein n=1 Tax=Candidatus Nitrososphaera evergladensis TaxID=1459637 RepID=UPI0011E60081|nr:hypothetical protein [Candidatus Nitrososphaera evergladensis]